MKTWICRLGVSGLLVGALWGCGSDGAQEQGALDGNNSASDTEPISDIDADESSDSPDSDAHEPGDSTEWAVDVVPDGGDAAEEEAGAVDTSDLDIDVQSDAVQYEGDLVDAMEVSDTSIVDGGDAKPDVVDDSQDGVETPDGNTIDGSTAGVNQAWCAELEGFDLPPLDSCDHIPVHSKIRGQRVTFIWDDQEFTQEFPDASVVCGSYGVYYQFYDASTCTTTPGGSTHLLRHENTFTSASFPPGLLKPGTNAHDFLWRVTQWEPTPEPTCLPLRPGFAWHKLPSEKDGPGWLIGRLQSQAIDPFQSCAVGGFGAYETRQGAALVEWHYENSVHTLDYDMCTRVIVKFAEWSTTQVDEAGVAASVPILPTPAWLPKYAILETRLQEPGYFSCQCPTLEASTCWEDWVAHHAYNKDYDSGADCPTCQALRDEVMDQYLANPLPE